MSLYIHSIFSQTSELIENDMNNPLLKKCVLQTYSLYDIYSKRDKTFEVISPPLNISIF